MHQEGHPGGRAPGREGIREGNTHRRPARTDAKTRQTEVQQRCQNHHKVDNVPTVPQVRVLVQHEAPRDRLEHNFQGEEHCEHVLQHLRRTERRSAGYTRTVASGTKREAEHEAHLEDQRLIVAGRTLNGQRNGRQQDKQQDEVVEEHAALRATNGARKHGLRGRHDAAGPRAVGVRRGAPTATAARSRGRWRAAAAATPGSGRGLREGVGGAGARCAVAGDDAPADRRT